MRVRSKDGQCESIILIIMNTTMLYIMIAIDILLIFHCTFVIAFFINHLWASYLIKIWETIWYLEDLQWTRCGISCRFFYRLSPKRTDCAKLYNSSEIYIESFQNVCPFIITLILKILICINPIFRCNIQLNWKYMI